MGGAEISTNPLINASISGAGAETNTALANRPLVGLTNLPHLPVLVREDRLFSRVHAEEDAGSGGQTPRAAAGYEASSRSRGPEQ